MKCTEHFQKLFLGCSSLALIVMGVSCGRVNNGQDQDLYKWTEQNASSLKVNDLDMRSPYKLKEIKYEISFHSSDKGIYLHKFANLGAIDNKQDHIALNEEGNGVYLANLALHLPLVFLPDHKSSTLSAHKSIVYTLSFDTKGRFFRFNTNEFDTRGYALMSLFDSRFLIEEEGKRYYEFTLENYHSPNAHFLGWIHQIGSETIFKLVGISETERLEIVTLSYSQ